MLHYPKEKKTDERKERQVSELYTLISSFFFLERRKI